MSILKELNLKIIKENYFNFLFIMIMPTFIVGQFLFKFVLFLIILSGFISYRLKVFNFDKNFLNILFIIVLLYFTLNSIFVSSFYFTYNIRFITFISIFLFFLITNYLIINDLINLKLIFKMYLILLSFVYIDSIYQFIYLEDIFGFHYYHNYQRFAGPFGDEYILAAFMSFFSIPALLFFLKDIRGKNIYFLFIFFHITIYVALKSGERIAFLTILLQILLILLIFEYKKNFKHSLIFVGSVLIIILAGLSDKEIIKKYQHFYNIIFKYEMIVSPNDNKIIRENSRFNSISFLNNQTGAHFLTAYKIWQNYPILGVGIKNFRIESNNQEYSLIKSHQAKHRAATHPHNFQLELLSETGLVGFLLFNFFILLFLYNYFFNINLKNKDKYILNIFIVILISKYFPIKTDSSLFSSSLGALFWIFLVCALASYNKLIKN